MSRTTETHDRALRMRLSMLSSGSLWQSKKSLTYRTYTKDGARLYGPQNNCLVRPGDIIMIISVEEREDAPQYWRHGSPWFDITFLVRERVFKAGKVFLQTFTEDYIHLKDTSHAHS